MELGLESSTKGDWSVVAVRGEIDLHTAPQLRERLVALVEDGASRVVVDLTEVGFMDSSGLGVLVGLLKRVRESGGQLAVVCGEGTVLKVLSITGLDQVIPVSASLDEATGV